MGKTTELKAGGAAPKFSSIDQDGSKVSLNDYKGKWLVLYFYPKDMTSGCTVEANDFTKAIGQFKKLGAEVVGVSPDSCERHKKFIAKEGLKLTLLSDESHDVCNAYGVWQEKSLYGRKFMGIVRSTFLIDPKGKLAQVWPKVSVTGHVSDVLAELKNAQ